jgi:hypothetical protein
VTRGCPRQRRRVRHGRQHRSLHASRLAGHAVRGRCGRLATRAAHSGTRVRLVAPRRAGRGQDPGHVYDAAWVSPVTSGAPPQCRALSVARPSLIGRSAHRGGSRSLPVLPGHERGVDPQQLAPADSVYSSEAPDSTRRSGPTTNDLLSKLTRTRSAHVLDSCATSSQGPLHRGWRGPPCRPPSSPRSRF